MPAAALACLAILRRVPFATLRLLAGPTVPDAAAAAPTRQGARGDGNEQGLVRILQRRRACLWPGGRGRRLGLAVHRRGPVRLRAEASATARGCPGLFLRPWARRGRGAPYLSVLSLPESPGSCRRRQLPTRDLPSPWTLAALVGWPAVAPEADRWPSSTRRVTAPPGWIAGRPDTDEKTARHSFPRSRGMPCGTLCVRHLSQADNAERRGRPSQGDGGTRFDPSPVRCIGKNPRTASGS